MNMTAKILLSFISIGCFCLGNAGASELVERGLELDREKQYDQAVECWWQAAAQGDMSAIPHLNSHYNRLWSGFGDKRYSSDRNIAKKYIKSASDKDRQSRNIVAAQYTGNFIIIASEDAILEYSLDKIFDKRFKGGKTRVNDALLDLREVLYVPTSNGKVFTPIRDCGDAGKVPVVERGEVLKYFKLAYSGHIDDWMVFVRCPDDMELLIPFNDFHRYVYESKMKAFTNLCKNLGAKECKVTRLEINGHQENTNVQTKVMTPYGAANSENSLEKTKVSSDSSSVSFTFEGKWAKPKETKDSYWKDIEPIWQAMEESRLSDNKLKNYNGVFQCVSDMGVNWKSKNSFENVGLKVNVNVSRKEDFFKQIIWSYTVAFKDEYPISL